MTYEPLSYPEGWELEHSRFERACMWVPILGWMIAGLMEQAKIRPISRQLFQAMERRTVPPEVDWRTEGRREIGERIGQLCREAICWPNAHFIPEDRFEAMIEWRTGDLCEVIAIRRIEKEFGVSFGKDPHRIVSTSTLGDIITWVMEERHRNC